MLREDDFLFGPIRRLIEVVSRAEREHVEVDAAVRDLLGLELATVDALTPAALVALLSGEDERAVARRSALAELLEALAAPGPEGDDRRAKARLLRGA